MVSFTLMNEPCLIQNNTPLPLLIESWRTVEKRHELFLLPTILPPFTEKMYYSRNNEYIVSGLFGNTDTINNELWKEHGYKNQMICILNTFYGSIETKTQEFAIEFHRESNIITIDAKPRDIVLK